MCMECPPWRIRACPLKASSIVMIWAEPDNWQPTMASRVEPVRYILAHTREQVIAEGDERPCHTYRKFLCAAIKLIRYGGMAKKD